MTLDTLLESPVPAYSAPKVGPIFEIFVRSIVVALPMVHSPALEASPVPDVLAPNVTPSLMMFPRSIVALDPAMSCVIAPELLRICWRTPASKQVIRAYRRTGNTFTQCFKVQYVREKTNIFSAICAVMSQAPAFLRVYSSTHDEDCAEEYPNMWDNFVRFRKAIRCRGQYKR